MSVVRRFLVAPSLARLIRKERGGSRVTEGYFAPQAGRTSFVRIDGQDCHLILVTTDANGRASEQKTEVPRAHGDALLDVCSGKAAYDRTTLPLGNGRDAVLDRYVTPPGLNLATVTFDDENAASGFLPPAWFSTDVSADGSYDRLSVATSGVPATGEVGLTNAALDAVLDLVEPRFGFGSGSGALRRPTETPKPAETPRPAAALGSVTPPAASSEPVPPARPAAIETPPAPTMSAIPEPPVAPPPAAREATPPPRGPAPQGEDKGDARIDDVIENLSAALNAAIQQPREPAREEDAGGAFERWTVRPRRTTQ